MVELAPRWSPTLAPIARYGGAVAMVVAALLGSWGLEPHLVSAPELLFVCAVMASAWLGGLGPGLLATALSVLAFNYYFTAPLYSLTVDARDIPRILLFGLVALFVGLLSGAQRRVEARLRDSEERFRLLAESALTGIYLIQGGRFRYANPALARMFGCTADELVDRLDPLELVYPEDRSRVAENLGRGAGGGVEAIRYEFRGLRKDGTMFFAEAHGSRIEHGGQTGVIGTLVDVTERKRAEEALREAQAELTHLTRVATLGELAASIAHEVNQPLTALVNNASACVRWLAAQNLEEARRSAQLVIAEGHRAGEIIGRIRALARKAPPQPGWLDLNQTIGEVLAMLRGELHRHQVALETQLADDLPPLWADRVQVQQVLLNLLMNGIEALSGVGEGPRDLEIRSQHVPALPAEAGPAEAAGSYALVEVRDTGVGLSPQGLERLFEAFYTTKPQGLGMGLAISRSIIQAHGGRLWAKADLPRGAAFAFAVPIRQRGQVATAPRTPRRR